MSSTTTATAKPKSSRGEYFIIAARNNRKRKKLERQRLVERNAYLENNMPLLKQKYTALLGEYNAMKSHEQRQNSKSSFNNSNETVLVKEELLFYRNLNNKVLGFMDSIRKEASLQKKVFQVRRNYYKLLSLVSSVRAECLNETKFKSLFEVSLNGQTQNISTNSYFRERYIGQRVEKLMRIDFNQIPMDSKRLSHLWCSLQEDNSFILNLKAQMSSQQSTLKKVPLRDKRKYTKTIFSNDEFKLTTIPSISKNTYLSGMQKEETQTIVLKTSFTDYTCTLEDLHKEHASKFKAVIFKRCPDKLSTNLSIIFSYKDPTSGESSLSKEGLREDRIKLSRPDKQVQFAETLIKYCLRVSS